MSTNIIHPYNLPPPPHWAQLNSVPAAEYRDWLMTTPSDQPKKRAKFNQVAGYFPDLGLRLKSMLEANTGRLLVFLGFEVWEDKTAPPPATGRYVAYEWQKYRLDYKRGKEGERALWYLPDWHLWTDGALSIWESKGLLDQRSKRLLRLMEGQHMPVVLITAEELDARKAEALYAARRRGEKALEIPHWGEGPKEN